ncbi:MAG TPA: glycosyltransferase [Candidatus Kryptonia bacterium]
MIPQVSVVIVSYNVRGFLENLLASLRRALEGVPSETIVVDNFSDDDTVEFVRKNHPNVKLIENRTNVGFGRANNQGVSASTGEYLLIINPDAVVAEDTVKRMLEFSEKHPESGASSCKVLNADGTLQKSCRRSFPTPWVAFTKISGLSFLFPRTKMFGKYNLTYLNPGECHEVDAIGGSFMFIPRAVFKKVGGFDEDYFMYGEDLDLCYKIKKAGYKIYYNPETTAIHFKGESTRRSTIKQTYEFYRAMIIFVEKRYGSGTMLSRLLNVAIVLSRFAHSFSHLLRDMSPVLIDYLISVCAMFVGEYLRVHKLYSIPSYGKPVFYLAPGIILVTLAGSLGVYGENKFSIRYSFLTAFLTFLLVSAGTYFFKAFAFSRLIVLIAGIFMVILIPGWRLVYQLRSSVGTSRHPVFGRRTLVVGMDQRAIELIRKMRGRIAMGFDIIGVVSEGVTDEARLLGIKVVGTLSELPEIVRERRADDVVFASGRISYAQVLQAVASVRDKGVHFKLVPDTMDVIIGKTYVDGLADVPLVDINYSINRRRNKILKRSFDIFFVLVAGMILLPARLFKRDSTAARVFGNLSRVLNGSWSVVGRSEYYPQGGDEIFGKLGITGVVQLNRGQTLSEEEVEKLYVYYARNQSIWLDLEIIAKSFLQLLTPAA